MSTNNHILVTGANRSGSTWVGKVLASNRKVDNIVEPLNLNRVKRFQAFELDFWYPKVTESTDSRIKKNVGDIVSYYLNTSPLHPLSRAFTSYEGHSLARSFRIRSRRALKPVKLLKDPTALFAVPWLVEQFGLKPVILIRHPAAYVLSIKEKNWWFDFNNLLQQRDFFSGALSHLKAEVEAFQQKADEKTIIENAALLWKVFYTQVFEYRTSHPDWFYITHEALSLDPLDEFEKMFRYLDLSFTHSTRAYILETTGTRQGGEFVRDSKYNATKWQDLLSEEEKKSIRQITGQTASEFYTNWE